ncbi:unnamed protein product, partial [Rotaria magnacalcarata]
MIYSQKK